MSEMKNRVDGISGSLDIVEGKVNGFEVTAIKTIQTRRNNEYKKNKIKDRKRWNKKRSKRKMGSRRKNE